MVCLVLAHLYTIHNTSIDICIFRSNLYFSEFDERLGPIISAFIFLGSAILHKSLNDAFKPFREKFGFSSISASHSDHQVANTLIKDLVVSENAAKLPHELVTSPVYLYIYCFT